jgi:hypothetical protein
MNELLESLKVIENSIFVESCAVDNVSDELRRLWRERDRLKEKFEEKSLTKDEKLVR